MMFDRPYPYKVPEEVYTADDIFQIIEKVQKGEIKTFVFNDQAKSFDVACIVRCKDCKHRFDGEHNDKCCEVLMQKAEWQIEIVTDDDWFCAEGERRTD